MVAVVTHQKYVASRHTRLRVIVERLVTVVDYAIGCAIGQRFAKDRQFAIFTAVCGTDAQSGKIISIARLVGIDRQQQRCFADLRHASAIQYDLPADHGDPITRQGNDAFDIVLIAVGWHNNDDVAIFRRGRKQP